MLNEVMQSSTIPVLEQVVNFAQSRHAVLAGNLANIDTPGYRTRDLSPEMFEARLREAIKTRHSNKMNASYGPVPDPIAQVGTQLDGILFHDDNNRSLESEVSAIAANELRHNMALALLSSQFRLLQAAVSEKAG